MSKVINEHNKGKIGSFKLGYSRGLPSYLAPKLFTDKRTEEFFVTSLYAQNIFENGAPVVGVESRSDDANMGADAVVKILNQPDITAQVTRFTLTDYLNRKQTARNRVERLADTILQKVIPPVRINVIMATIDNTVLPPNDKKLENALVQCISAAISNATEKLLAGDQGFINEGINDELLKEHYLMVTIQAIPDGHHSNFYGKDPLYIDFSFDDISFSEDDIKAECANIHRKKNGGKATHLLIWADMWEVLNQPDRIAHYLHAQFKNTTFDQVVFLAFHNRRDLVREGIYGTRIK